MFKNMKLGTKIVSGFAIVLLLTAVVGYVGYNGLGNVGDIVGKADSANRLIKLGQLARLEQKNYMAERDEKYEKLVAKGIDEITQLAAELNSRMNDQADKDGVKAARTAATNYHNSFKTWADQSRQQTAIYKNMVTAATDAIGQCEALRADQKKQLTANVKSDAAFVADKLWKADSANRLIKDAAEARIAQKNYMEEKDQKYAAEEDKKIKEIAALCDQLAAGMKQQVNKDQVAAAKTTGLAYDKNFKIWIELEQQKDKLAETMDKNAATFMAEVVKLSTDQKEKLAQEIKEGKDAPALTERASKSKVSDAIRIRANNCRQYQRDYKLTGDAKFQKPLADAVSDIEKDTKGLESKFNDQVNKDQAKSIATAARVYSNRFTEWVECGEKQKDAYGKMVTNAAAFVKECEALRTDQKAQLVTAQKTAAEQLDDKLFKADSANRLIKELQVARLAQKNFMSDKNQADAEKVATEMKAMTALCDTLAAAMKQKVNSDQVNATKSALLGYNKSFQSWCDLEKKQEEEYKTLLGAAAAFGEQCDKLRETQKDKMSSTTASSNTMMIGGALVAIILGSILAFVITRGITKPINRIIQGLTSGAEQTSSASGQVSSASQSLAQGASEQAASVEEVTSSIEEMASMTKQNATNADEAKSLAANAATGTDKGTEAMGRMSTAIEDIKKSSDETAKIIKTIDEIAFQTNLLALNAAVEAARAGEAGKGFAVVAEEVRNLAQRSAQAAKDTADMIEGSVKNADNGVAISSEVATLLDEIAESNRKVNDLVGEIAAASNEQSQGIDQINTAVGQMDQITQSNAANAEESASASEELSAQAEQLSGMVDQLQNLVGGSSGDAASNADFQADHGHRTPQKGRQATETQPSKAGGRKRAKATPVTVAVANEEEFPMDDDTDLGTF